MLIRKFREFRKSSELSKQVVLAVSLNLKSHTHAMGFIFGNFLLQDIQEKDPTICDKKLVALTDTVVSISIVCLAVFLVLLMLVLVM